MSFVFAAPEALAAAAADMAGIGSTLNAANVVAAVPTTGVLAAAADEVSTQVAALLSAHAQGYQQLSRQMMTAFHDQFVQALRASADAYATAEASAAQTMVNAVNAPARALLGHPLISADASTGGGSNALSRVQSMFLGTGGSSALGGSAAANAAASGALQLQPTGGASGLSAVGALLPRAGAAAAAALPALAAESIGNAIKNLYNAVEPWVQYGFKPHRMGGGMAALHRHTGTADQLLLLPRRAHRAGSPVQCDRLRGRDSHFQPGTNQYRNGHRGIDQPIHQHRDQLDTRLPAAVAANQPAGIPVFALTSD